MSEPFLHNQSKQSETPDSVRASAPFTKSPIQQLKAHLLADFSAWLDELDDDDFITMTGSSDQGESEDNTPGLQALFAELTALRQDARLQGKANLKLN